MDDKHFDKVFYFICGLTAIVFLFDCFIVFQPIPPSGVKYADILTGSLNTAWVMAGIQYLLGGNPKKPDAQIVQTGDQPIATTSTDEQK
jgi:hypothetical protein